MRIKMVTGLFRRAYLSFATHVLDVPPRLLSLLLFLLLVFFPVTIGGQGDPFYRTGKSILRILISANIYAILAASWDLLVRAGQMSLGHALFWGVGAYTTGLLSVIYGLPLWTTIPLSVLIGTLMALVVGFPLLRVKGAYLVLVTMALPLILNGLISPFKHLSLMWPILSGLPSFFPFLKTHEETFANYYFTLLLLLVASIILYKVANSKTGIVFVSILDDELASKASGINVTKYKLLAFAISGFFATLAGCVFAHVNDIANPASLEITISFMPIMMTILGGIGTIYGPIAGAYIYWLVDSYVLTKVVDIPTVWHWIIFALFVIVLIIKWPRGMARLVTEKLEDLQEERELEERGKHIWKREKKGEKK